MSDYELHIKSPGLVVRHRQHGGPTEFPALTFRGISLGYEDPLELTAIGNPFDAVAEAAALATMIDRSVVVHDVRIEPGARR